MSVGYNRLGQHDTAMKRIPHINNAFSKGMTITNSWDLSNFLKIMPGFIGWRKRKKGSNMSAYMIINNFVAHIDQL